VPFDRWQSQRQARTIPTGASRRITPPFAEFCADSRRPGSRQTEEAPLGQDITPPIRRSTHDNAVLIPENDASMLDTRRINFPSNL
jgi:hypothetical protein